MINVSNIERFATHDGPGIRTTIFLKGCPLHCPWCANPETWDVRPVLMHNATKCVNCQRCKQVCTNNAITFPFQWHQDRCQLCHKCEDICLEEAIFFSGQAMEIQDIVEEVLKDKDYYLQSDGGITISGGEPLFQLASFLELVKALKKEMRSRRAIMAQVADYLTEDDKAILHSEGFDIEERVSYRIEPDDIDAVVKRFHSDKRRTLRKAQGLTLDTAMTPDELYSLIKKAYGTAAYTRNLFTSLASAALENKSGVILRAKDSAGADAAALLLVHDNRIAYYLAYAIAPEHRTDGSMEWLTVEAMKYAFERGLTFDFEGSIIPNIARTYRHYGGQPAHYTLMTVYANPLVKLAMRALTHLSKG